MKHTNHCLYLQVMQYMSSSIGTERFNGIATCERAVFTSEQFSVNSIKQIYGPKQNRSLSHFPDEVLYRSYSFLEADRH